jgi:integrase
MKSYDRNKAKPGAKKNLWIRYWVKGKEVYEPGRGGEKSTNAWMAELRRQIAAGTWVHPKLRKTREAKFADYALVAIEKRIARGVGKNELPPGKTERGHVTNHLAPAFGKYLVRELTFKLILTGFQGLAEDDAETRASRLNHKGLGGKTVTAIHSTLRAILKEALEDELIEVLPPPLLLGRDHLPPLVDTRPEGWRDEAVFEAEEIRTLASCAEVPSARLIMYLVYFLTGSRFIEIVPLKVRDYIRARKPLAMLVVRAAKHKRQRGAERRRREVPVHPDLKAWLDWWLDSEYEVLFGNKPGPDDLLFPTVSVRRRNRGLQTVSHNELFKHWQRNDLPAAGLRHRRLHDARRTLLSALRNAGIDSELRRKITHWSVEDRVMDAYTTVEWKVLCEAMRSVEWNLPKPTATAAAASSSNVVNLRSRQ